MDPFKEVEEMLIEERSKAEARDDVQSKISMEEHLKIPKPGNRSEEEALAVADRDKRLSMYYLIFFIIKALTNFT